MKKQRTALLSTVWASRRPRLLALAFALAAPQGWAACTISAVGVSFGSYDTFSSQDLDGVGTVDVSCDISTAYTIALSQGGGTYTARAMVSGANTLLYNLFTDATRTVVWGDGSGATATVGNTAITASHTVYGRIPAGQNVQVGSYSDSITVTLTF